MTELDKILGDKNLSPLAGILRIVPIERMNALLVITPQPAYLDEAKKWIERLDKTAGTAVACSSTSSACKPARREPGTAVAAGVYRRASQTIAPSTPTLAPGTPPGTIVNPPSFTPVIRPGAARVSSPPQSLRRGCHRHGVGSGIVRNLQLVADKDNNTLLIVATASEYVVIESALRKLDVPSRQVVIEVTIAEVGLPTISHSASTGCSRLAHRRAVAQVGFNNHAVQSRHPRMQPSYGATLWRLAKGFACIINNTNFFGASRRR